MFLIAHRKRLSYYAVFDGHAGIRAAEHCVTILHVVLGDKFPKGIRLVLLPSNKILFATSLFREHGKSRKRNKEMFH